MKYLVVDVQYLKASGLGRAKRFSRVFDDFDDVLLHYKGLSDPENYLLIPTDLEKECEV